MSISTTDGKVWPERSTRNENLDELAGLKRLQTLNLEGTYAHGVTDKGLRTLAPLAELQALSDGPAPQNLTDTLSTFWSPLFKSFTRRTGISKRRRFPGHRQILGQRRAVCWEQKVRRQEKV